MKKICLVSPFYPFPPVRANQKDMVGRIGLFQELGYEVTVFAFPSPEQDFDVIADKKRHGVNVEILEKRNDFISKEYRFHNIWYQSHLLLNQASFNILNNFVQQNGPDVMWYEYAALSPLAHAISKVYEGKIIFRAHNSERRHYMDKVYINLRSNFKSALTWSYPLGLIRNIIGISKCERLMFKTAKQVACISKNDMVYFKRHHENAVCLPYFPPEEIVKHKNGPDKSEIDVFYFGSDLKNNINRSGLDFIAKKIIPILRKKDIKFITFHILGKNSREEYNSLDIPFLKIHGFIDDLNLFLDNMDVAIIPVFHGTGFKVKAYESLKRGFPVVASARALINFDGINGEDYFIAKKPEEFVKKLILLQDGNLREKMGNKASKLIAEDFSKEKVMQQLESILMV
ncbi:glycosyltransferase [Chloroflexota bacterium]